MSDALLIAYFAALGALALFGVHRLALVWAAWRAPTPEVGALDRDDAPTVLVQLPLYNEAFVAERVIRAVAALDYPQDKLTIQVLDDSTDGTQQIVDRTVAELAATGLQIEAVRRPERKGYKAGALAYGLGHSKAELVAIFDSDFVPRPDFLVRTVPVLADDPGCGLVQARWDHLNRNHSWLTRAQAIYLDGHFGVEHRARWGSGQSFNFNGTAGVWRRQAIDEGGGWRSDTITEDLDLSYRTQLAGWHFAYLDDVLVPAELPDRWTGFRAQQARWVRGSLETARRQLGTILTAKQWSISRRFEAAVHVTSNVTYLLMAIIGLLLPVTVVLRHQLGYLVPFGEGELTALDLSMLTAGTLAMIVFYAFSIRTAPAGAAGRYRDLPFALCLGAGMSISNAREVLRGLVSERSEFVRTPKRGATSLGQLVKTYQSPNFPILAAVELLLASYHAAAIAYAGTHQLWGAIPFFLLYLVGFAAVGGGVMRETLAGLRRRPSTLAPRSPSTSA